MDASTIQAIVDLAARTKGAPTEHTALVPKSAELVSVEKYLAAPRRFRRSFSTQRFGDFIAYVKEHGSSDSAVFIAPDLSTIVAVLNHGNSDAPQWGDNTAKLDLKFEPEFAEFFARTGRAIPQRDLIDFLEDWLPTTHVAAMDDNGSQIDPKTAIAAARKVTISAKSDVTHQQGDVRAARSALESVEASGAEVSLPSGLLFTGMIYHGLPQYTVTARLGMRLTEKEPAFTLRLVGWQSQLATICADAEDMVRTHLSTTIPVFVGSSAGNYSR